MPRPSNYSKRLTCVRCGKVRTDYSNSVCFDCHLDNTAACTKTVISPWQVDEAGVLTRTIRSV